LASIKSGLVALRDFDAAFDRFGSWPAVRHHPNTLPQRLGKLTIRLVVNRNAEAFHDAANLAK
jgi:hypothetical protein